MSINKPQSQSLQDSGVGLWSERLSHRFSGAGGAEELHLQAFTECAKNMSPSEAIMLNAAPFEMLTDDEHCTETQAVKEHSLVLYVSFHYLFLPKK